MIHVFSELFSTSFSDSGVVDGGKGRWRGVDPDVESDRVHSLGPLWSRDGYGNRSDSHMMSHLLPLEDVLDKLSFWAGQIKIVTVSGCSASRKRVTIIVTDGRDIMLLEKHTEQEWEDHTLFLSWNPQCFQEHRFVLSVLCCFIFPFWFHPVRQVATQDTCNKFAR